MSALIDFRLSWINQYFILAARSLHVHCRSRYNATAYLLVCVLLQHSFMVWTVSCQQNVGQGRRVQQSGVEPFCYERASQTI